jgi:tripartite-type tricarboxylate transporter receptor subunit TctC
VRRQLSDLIGEINARPEFIKQMEEAGFAMLDVSYDEMDAFMAERKETYRKIAEQLQSAN